MITIKCAICDKLVDKVSWYDDYLTNERVIKSFCHGQVEEKRIRLETLTREQLKQLELEKAFAFEE